MEEKFEQWALLELFGHMRIAGKVTEQSIAGGALLRVDVPETKKCPGFTRFFGISAIYSINPVTEKVARAMAEQMAVMPVTEWDIDVYINRQKMLQSKFPENNC